MGKLKLAGWPSVLRVLFNHSSAIPKAGRTGTYEATWMPISQCTGRGAPRASDMNQGAVHTEYLNTQEFEMWTLNPAGTGHALFTGWAPSLSPNPALAHCNPSIPTYYRWSLESYIQPHMLVWVSVTSCDKEAGKYVCTCTDLQTVP